MNNPYLIPEPFVVHYSGGRTSGYMLHQILEAYKFRLPSESFVIFTNTGKEFHQTLDFIHETETHWPVKVIWLEYMPNGYREVDYASAARDGEPFDALIEHKGYLPNPVSRLCTQYLKIETCLRYISDWWGASTEFNGVIGIRYDEPKRWGSRGQDPRHPARYVLMPLIETQITQQDVLSWWEQQPFNLQLHPRESNCDLCFLKSQDKRIQIMRDHPKVADWWIANEISNRELTGRNYGGGFRSPDRKDYLTLYEISKAAEFKPTEDPDLQEIECSCTD